MPQDQETDPTDGLASYSQAQNPWEPTGLGKEIEGRPLTCPARGIDSAAFLRPPQGRQLYLELGACSQLGPGEVLGLPG